MAGGFLSLTAFQAEGCGGGFAASKKKGRGWRRGLCKRVASLRSGGDSACGAEGCGIAPWAMSIKPALRDLLSVSHGMISILVIGSEKVVSRFPFRGDELYSFPSVLHTGARLSARDDDVDGHPYRHFDRSEAEWRNLTPPWFMKHWGRRSLDSELHIA